MDRKNVRFQRKTDHIWETVRNTAKVIINHWQEVVYAFWNEIKIPDLRWLWRSLIAHLCANGLIHYVRYAMAGGRGSLVISSRLKIFRHRRHEPGWWFVTNNNSKFRTKEIVGAQNFSLVLKFRENCSALSFIISDQIRRRYTINSLAAK